MNHETRLWRDSFQQVDGHFIFLRPGLVIPLEQHIFAINVFDDSADEIAGTCCDPLAWCERHSGKYDTSTGDESMTYLVNDMFYTLQGEGHHAGRPAVFVRFAKCNLWTGREADRASAVCNFCDTEFTTVKYRFDDPRDLVELITDHLPENAWDERTPMVVLTGGEPLLQVDDELLDAMYATPLYVSVETNGTQPIKRYFDWVCVSPKILTRLAVTRADEVKLVYPQPGIEPETVRDLIDADSYRLQPMDGPNLADNTRAAIDYCLANPHWSLSVQTHKVIGIP